MAQTPLPSFLDLVSKAKSFELFQKSLDSSGLITFNLAQLSETSLAIIRVATHLPTVAMVVPTAGKAAVRHAAKSAPRKGTTLISATNSMHRVENLLAPHPTLQRPLRPPTLLMSPSPMTGTWTKGLRPT
ncbi:hypothetical protein PVL29_012246 [Vitis rotundifolia]|uniref:Uncharacterized protein n=1 Tax=Vitis rotundifolia TaxID=103349 RepID=A0AA38ZR25_VITRO|nr:hypothetical protein PVL29_012246 [Vitis rotundifolia]